MKRSGKKALAVILVLIITAAVCICLVVLKQWNINRYFVWKYPLRGVDVSHYQGKISWEALKAQGIDFAYIKATEGSEHEDERFRENWQEAGESKMLAGAYHFFSFDSSGVSQAEWYIRTVGDLDGKLCPAVDVEYYGGKEMNPPDRDETVRQLRQCLETLEGHYGKKPVIYTTYKVYRRYIEENFGDYPLWIRNVYYPPWDLGEDWQSWQYMDTAVLEGYEGAEPCIDLDVFAGTEAELKEYLIDNKERGECL